jgi:arylsulfatase A-like enzyme
MGCGGPAEPERDPDIVLIMVDTLRADHLPGYGYTRIETPHIDAFLDSAIVFEQARSQAACTFPSVNSLLTSLQPQAFVLRADEAAPVSVAPGEGAREQFRQTWQAPRGDARFGIPEEAAYLPEVLSRKGYRTIAVSASTIVRASSSEEAVNRWGGFGRGFEVFHEDCLDKDAACVNQAFLELLDDGADGRPVFAYLHLIDPHAPYLPPVAPDELPEPPPGCRPAVAKGNPNPIASQLKRVAVEDLDVEPGEIEHLRNLYDEEIRYLDRRFGELMAGLEQRGMSDSSILVFVADHGEAFLDPDTLLHCSTVNENEVRVPLAIRLVGEEARPGLRINEAASLVDVMPTLLEAIGVEPASLDLDGASLLASIPGHAAASAKADGAPSRYSFSAQRAHRAVFDGRFKLHLDLVTGEMRLVDPGADPEGKTDLSETYPEARRSLEGVLLEFLREHEGEQFATEGVDLGLEVEESLRALGYIP